MRCLRAGRALIGCGIVAVLLFLPTVSRGQPPRPPEDQAPQRPARDAEQDRPGATPVIDRESFANRLRSRLDRLDSEQRRIEQQRAALASAIKAIEDGEPLDQIWRDLAMQTGPDLSGPRSRFRGQPADRPGPGDRRGPDERVDRPQGDRDVSSPRHATEEEKRIIDQILESTVSGLSRVLKDECKQNEEQCQAAYDKALGSMQDLIRDAQNDEPLFRLRLEELRTSQDVFYAASHLVQLQQKDPAADAEALVKAEQSLDGLLESQFDLRLSMRLHELGRMRKLAENIARRIEELELEVATQQAIKAQTIAQQRADMLQRVRHRIRGRGTPPPLHEDGPGPSDG